MTDKSCGTSFRGWGCTREPGHSGLHVAATDFLFPDHPIRRKSLCAVWTDGEPGLVYDVATERLTIEEPP